MRSSNFRDEIMEKRPIEAYKVINITSTKAFHF